MPYAAAQSSEIKIKLSVVKGPHLGKVFQLSKSIFTIGRGPENDVILMNDPQISRAHAQISVVDRDLEISNLSNKNAIFVQGESVHKWKILNNTNFTVGDSEICVEYNLGPVAVVTVQKPSNVLQLKVKATAAQPAVGLPANKNSVPLTRQPPVINQHVKTRPNQNLMAAESGGRPQPQQLSGAQGSSMAHPRFKIYLGLAIVIGGLYYYFSAPDKNSRAKKITSTLRYEDEINAKMTSKREVDREAEREARSKERAKSPQAFRINESFVRGMRDYQLGNYIRAQEFFQLILNLDPDHALAKRYLYLSKIRFDELVQEKLMLGESYFNKHNFRMCESLYRQVTDMLNGKNNDQKFQLASKKARECELAAEGIR